MKKRISLLVVFVLILTMLCGCGSKDSEIPAPDTANTENSDGEKSAVNDNKNDYSSLFSDAAGEIQAKVSDTKDTTSTPVPTKKVETTTTSVSDTKETDLLTVAKKNKIWTIDTWGTVNDIDYYGADAVESALNAGKKLDDKTVMIETKDAFSDSTGGYINAGKNLYIMSSNTGVSKVKYGDILVFTIQSVEGYDLGNSKSWFIYADIFSEPSSSDSGNSGYDNDDDWSWLYDDPTPIPTEEPANYTYESNQYFDVVESYTYKDGRYTYIVDKVLGKADNTNVDLTMFFYDKNDEVIDKCTPDVTVNKGYYNFITYWTEEDDFDHYTISYTGRSGWRDGDPDPVKMVKYTKKDKKVLITFEQTGQIGSFAEFKLLFFKDGKLVKQGSWYFDVYVKQLTGVGSTDVAELSVSADFDTLEYYYGP